MFQTTNQLKFSHQHSSDFLRRSHEIRSGSRDSDLALGSHIAHGGQPGDRFTEFSGIGQQKEGNYEHTAAKMGNGPKLGMWNTPIETEHFISLNNNVEFANDNVVCTSRNGNYIPNC